VTVAAGRLAAEERLELLRRLVEAGAPVFTYYRRRRVVGVRREGPWVVLRFADGEERRIHVTGHFAKLKFVAVI
jgi:hypothetical protein